MSKIAIIVPGIGYTTDRSLLYFAGKVAQNAGYEILKIRFSGFEKGVKGDPEKMKRAFDHAYNQLMEQLPTPDKKDEVLFISKSIGTAVSLKADIEKEIRAKHILFTPLIETMELLQKLIRAQDDERQSDMLVFHGLDDPWAADNDSMKEMAGKSGLEYHEIAGANHSLETGEPVADLENQKKIMEICQGFLKK